jgi:hypothetical protein
LDIWLASLFERIGSKVTKI